MTPSALLLAAADRLRELVPSDLAPSLEGMLRASSETWAEAERSFARDRNVINPSVGELYDCGCHHCRKGRMCKHMADLYRARVKLDNDLQTIHHQIRTILNGGGQR